MLGPIIVWAVILLFIFPFYLIAVILFGLWRLLVNFIVWKWKSGKFLAHFTSRDLVFTCDDFQGKVRKSIINVLVLDGVLELNALKEAVQRRLLDNEYFYKMHCRPVLFMGYWFWEKTELHIDSHVFEHEVVRTSEELKTFLPYWGAQNFVPNGPLWNVMIVRLSCGKTALISKYHHMLGDGVSFMKYLEYFCDVGWTHLQVPPPKSLTLMHWLYAWFTFPWNALKSYRLARIRKGFRPNSYCGEGFTSWTEIPLEKVRIVRKETNSMFQSALGGIISNAFYRTLEHYGKSDIPKTIRLVVPIPYPGRTEKCLTNHIGWLHVELPIGGGEGPLLQFNENLKRSYGLGMHGTMWELFRGLYLIPEPMLKKYTYWGEVNIPPVILSSVPGSLDKMHFLGLEILNSLPIVGLGCSMGVNATATTYKDNIHVTMRVSKEVIPSQELLDTMMNKFIHEELDSLYNKVIGRKSDSDAKSSHIEIKL